MAYSNTPNLQPYLERLTSRSVLTQQEQQAVLGLPGHAQQVRSNRDFVRLGATTDHVSLVVAGIVGRFDQSSDGKRQITAMHIAGDMCDLHAVVQPLATSALQALSVATILRIPHSSIRGAAARFPALAEALWRDSTVDSAILAEWVVNVGRRDAKTRVAHVICEMASRLHVSGHGNDFTFNFPVTQAQLGEITALTSVHINRTLRSLKADGLLEWHQRLIRVPDWNALKARAEFNPAYLQTDVQSYRIIPTN